MFAVHRPVKLVAIRAREIKVLDHIIMTSGCDNVVQRLLDFCGLWLEKAGFKTCILGTAQLAPPSCLARIQAGLNAPITY